MPFAALVPADTPDRDQSASPIPATGPYEIVESNPGRGWSYARNPQWAKNNSKLMPDLPSGHVDKIEIEVVRNQSTQVNDVEQGKSNWMFDPLPADRVAEVEGKYEGTQYRSETVDQHLLLLDEHDPGRPSTTSRFARRSTTRSTPTRWCASTAASSTPGQQILPPGMPGHEEFELYPHDMAKAKAADRRRPTRRIATSPSGPTTSAPTTTPAPTTRRSWRSSASTRS